jgi:ribonuclease P protein component
MVEEKLWPEDAPRAAGSFRPNLPRRERTSDWKKRAIIIDRGVSSKYENLLISILPQPQWQLSVVVKRGCGIASERNTYKRKIKESYRLCKPNCSASAGVAVTIFKKTERLRVKELRDFLINQINSLTK